MAWPCWHFQIIIKVFKKKKKKFKKDICLSIVFIDMYIYKKTPIIEQLCFHLEWETTTQFINWNQIVIIIFQLNI